MLVDNVGEAELCFTGQFAAVMRVGDGIVQSLMWHSLCAGHVLTGVWTLGMQT